MPNLTRFKLGKAPAKHDPRTLCLADYLDTAVLPPPPKEVRYSDKVKAFPMLLNDELGDCTIVANLHQLQVWNDNAGHDLIVTDKEALEGYERICGYNPKDPNSDQGGVVLDVLNAFRKDGIGGRKIEAFVKVDTHDDLQMRTAIDLFGGLILGVGLPLSAQNQTVWTSSHGPNGAAWSWGGHCINVPDYFPHYSSYRFVCITWGVRQTMTASFVHKYADEGYVIVTKDWLDAKGASPTGLNLEALLADLRAVTGVHKAASEDHKTTDHGTTGERRENIQRGKKRKAGASEG